VGGSVGVGFGYTAGYIVGLDAGNGVGGTLRE